MEDNDNTPYYMHKELAEKVDKMEAGFKDLDKRGAITDVILTRLEQAFNRNTEAVSDIGKAVGSLEKTMVTMQAEVKNWATATSKLGEEVNQIKENFNVSEEKAKVDFRLIWKNLVQSRVFWILGGIGVLIWFILQAIANIDLVALMKILGKG